MILSILMSIIGFIILFGILVFFHEMGHFVAAKSLGVGVESFSLGFGPRLWGFKRGETDYRISAFPLGGYVKIKGMEGSAPDDEDSFYNKPHHYQLIILLAGALINIILGFFFLSGTWFLGTTKPAYSDKPPIVEWVHPGHPGVDGLRQGDLIVEVEGRPVSNWEEAEQEILKTLSGTVTLTVRRGQSVEHVTVTGELDKKSGAFLYPFLPFPPAVIAEVQKDSPAEKAGLQKGDIIFKVDEKYIQGVADFSVVLQKKGDKGATLYWKRGQTVMQGFIRPFFDPTYKRYRIGVVMQGIQMKIVRVKNPLKALAYGWKDSVMSINVFFKALGQLIRGKLPIQTLSGPISIARFAGAVVENISQSTNWNDMLIRIGRFFKLLGFISIQLGIINLLPIPALDGGHATLILISLGKKTVTGRGLSPQFREIVALIGVGLLIALTLFVLILDILKAG